MAMIEGESPRLVVVGGPNDSEIFDKKLTIENDPNPIIDHEAHH